MCISLISIYLLKNSYYVKIRKLKILTRIGNHAVCMSDCSSVVARDGNNKVSITDRLFEVNNVISYKFNETKFSFIVAF